MVNEATSMTTMTDERWRSCPLHYWLCSLRALWGGSTVQLHNCLSNS